MASSSRLPPSSQATRRWNSSSFKTRIERKPPGHKSERPAEMELPDRFKHDEDDDVDDGTGVGGGDAPFIQQSVYGMLAATQSRVNFPGPPFQQQSGGESEDESDGGKGWKSCAVGKTPRKDDSESASSSVRTGREARTTKSAGSEARIADSAGSEARTTKIYGNRPDGPDGKLFQSLLRPTAMIENEAQAQKQDAMTQSQFLPSREKVEMKRSETSRLETKEPDKEAQAAARLVLEPLSGPPNVSTAREGDRTSLDSPHEAESKSLPHIIAGIFQFGTAEEVLSEYPCWYLQNVLLQGYMYITQKHVCFYSYLPRKTNVTVKTGHLGKRGRHSYRYRRYWFVLRGDIFSYYKHSTDPYFPLGQVDLRYALSAEISKQTDDEAAAYFTITTPDRCYYYRADTLTSAREWVKQLQKIMFRSRNEGDSVKISLPIQNLVDVEQTNMVEFAKTVKLRILSDDETFAVDEYFFTFFSLGQEAVSVLKALTDGNRVRQALQSDQATSPAQSKRKVPLAQPPSQSHLPSQRPAEEPVRSAMSLRLDDGRASPRVGSEHPGSSVGEPHTSTSRERANLDRGRRGSDASGRSASWSPTMKESSESFVMTSEQAASSSMNQDSEEDDDDDDDDDGDMSASQMLTGDGVFHGPTLRRHLIRRKDPSGDTIEDLYSQPLHSSPNSGDERDGVQPPLRRPTDQPLGKTRPVVPKRQNSNGSNRTIEPDDGRLYPAETSTPARLVRGISTPLQHAMTMAGIVRSSGKRMGSYLSSSPKTYVNNWSAALVGGKRHYTGVEGLAPDDSVGEPEQDAVIAEHERRFQDHFGLSPSEKLLSVFFCWIHKTVPLYGKIYMGARHFCFRSLWYGINTRLVIPYKDILNVQKQRGFRWGYPGMVLVIRGYEELFFEFSRLSLRDDAVVTVLRKLEAVQAAAQSTLLTLEEQQDAAAAATENKLLQAARKDGYADRELYTSYSAQQIELNAPPILFDDPSASVLDFKPEEALRITCLTIGSRGDVQPYIALCKGLIAEGHQCKIATHVEFKGWVEKHGIEFAPVNGDPAELMRVCVENGMFTPAFFLEVNSTFRTWLDELLVSAWDACQHSDLLIESPSAMCGIHIAEALEIPYFRAFTMPWTRTRAYPHAFAVPNSKLGGGYNYMTYTFFDNIFWQAIAGQINRWRRKTLGLGPTSLDKLQQNKVPFLYNFSPSVVAPPLDFSDWIKITGYWFLDEGEKWDPSEDLVAFIQKARKDKQKLVYIGFGSVTVSDSKKLMQQIVDAVVKADVRCILAKGWSDHYDKHDPATAAVQMPSCIHQIRSAPHDWLFQQVDAIVHHGGAGTTGASLRAGKPTIIKPFFGDQFFFATRVEDLGVGISLKKITANRLGKALWIATNDARMRCKAALIGESIRGENGVQTAINAIYRDLDYAKSLIKKRHRKSAANAILSTTSTLVDGYDNHPQWTDEDMLTEDTEENWTFIEKDGNAKADEEGPLESPHRRQQGKSESNNSLSLVVRTNTRYQGHDGRPRAHLPQ